MTAPYQFFSTQQMLPAQTTLGSWEQMKNGESGLCGILLNKGKQVKPKKSDIHPAEATRFLANNSGTVMGLGENTIISDQRPPGQTQVNSIRLDSVKFHSSPGQSDVKNISLNFIQFHSCKDDDNMVEINLGYSNS